jgi:hypothetical protein
MKKLLSLFALAAMLFATPVLFGQVVVSGQKTTLAGDATGPAGSNTVAKIQTRPVATTAPSTGNQLAWSGSAWTPGPANLAGGANYVTGVLPAGNLPDSTTSAKGIVQLTQDFGGTATSPTVLALTGASGVVPVRGTAALAFHSVPATAGDIRLPESSTIQARNFANSANFKAVEAASDIVYFGENGWSFSYLRGSNVLIEAAGSTERIALGGSSSYFLGPSFTLKSSAIANMAKFDSSTSTFSISLPTLAYAEDMSAPTITQSTPVGNSATHDLTIRSQTPNAGATGTNRNPGNVVYAVPSPAAGGATGYHSFTVSGTEYLRIGGANRVIDYSDVATAGQREEIISFTTTSTTASQTIATVTIPTGVTDRLEVVFVAREGAGTNFYSQTAFRIFDNPAGTVAGGSSATGIGPTVQASAGITTPANVNPILQQVGGGVEVRVTPWTASAIDWTLYVTHRTRS